MMLDRNAQDPEAVHPDCGVLYPCLALQDMVDGLGEEPNESVPLRGRNEYSREFEPQDFTHDVQRRGKLRGSIPASVLDCS